MRKKCAVGKPAARRSNGGGNETSKSEASKAALRWTQLYPV